MNTWAPLFGKVVDSSLWDLPDGVVKIFLTMLAKKDADHVVRANAYMIGRWSRKTEKEVLEALKILSNPDKTRLEKQPEEGRRIKKVEEGWLMINGQKYEEMASLVSQRVRKARWERENRLKKKGTEGTRENTEDIIRVHEANAEMHKKHADELKKEISNEQAR